MDKIEYKFDKDNNLYLYIKKVIIMSVFFLINSYIVLLLKYFTLLKIVKLLK